LQVISLAQFTMAHTRGWAANSPNSRIHLKAKLRKQFDVGTAWTRIVWSFTPIGVGPGR
jgi:hypothetical protein